MSVLGIGQVPITLLLGIFMFCWGACGMTMNQMFTGVGKYPLVYIWPSMGITFAISFLVTRAMAAIVARTLPTEETFGVSRRELIGLTGKAVFTISAKGGTVDIKDKYGTVHREQAKTGEENSNVISGTEVLVLDYDVTDHKFVVKGGGF
jgi:membrane protein implicated in regulation of membrane protease activity